MNINELKDFEIEEEPTQDQPLNIADLEDFEEEEEYSQLDSLLRGAAQGLTFGFADEIAGAGGAVVDTLKGDSKLSNLLNAYRENRDISRSRFKEAEEQNPASFFAGDIGAGVTTGALTGGAGAVANLGRVGAKAGIKELAKVGLKQGAAAGAGYSEGDTLGEVATDTALGGLVGAGAGAALPIAGKGISKGVDATLDAAGRLSAKARDKAPEIIKKAGTAYDLAKKGVPVSGTAAEEALRESSLKSANDLLELSRQQYQKASKRVNDALTSKSNKKVDFSSELKTIEDAVNNSSLAPDDLRRVQKQIDQFKDITTSETVDSGTMKALADLDSKIKAQTAASEALNAPVSFTKPEVLPEAGVVQSVRTTTNPAGEAVADVIQSKIPDDEIITNTVERFKNVSLEEMNNIKRELNNLQKSTSIDPKTKGVISQMLKAIDESMQKNMGARPRTLYEAGNKSIANLYEAGSPKGMISELNPKNRFEKNLDIPLSKKLLSTTDETLSRTSNLLDGDTTQLFDQISQNRKLSEIQKVLKGEGTLLGPVSPSGGVIRVGEAAGTIARKTEPFVKKLSEGTAKTYDFTRNLVNADEAFLRKTSETMRNMGEAGEGFARVLDKAANDSTKKDKLLWSLSQQPAFREMLKDFYEEEEEQ